MKVEEIEMLIGAEEMLPFDDITFDRKDYIERMKHLLSRIRTLEEGIKVHLDDNCFYGDYKLKKLLHEEPCQK